MHQTHTLQQQVEVVLEEVGGGLALRWISSGLSSRRNQMSVSLPSLLKASLKMPAPASSRLR